MLYQGSICRWYGRIAAGAAVFLLSSVQLADLPTAGFAQEPLENVSAKEPIKDSSEGPTRIRDEAPALDSLDAAQKKMLAAMLAAQLDALQQLKSGVGRAKLHTLDESGWQTTADVQVRFNGDRYKLQISYPPSEKRPFYIDDRYVVVNDGSATFVNTFSERLKPTGCQVSVFDDSALGLRQAVPGFLWQPNRLPLVSMGALDELVKQQSITIRRQNDGSYICTVFQTQDRIAHLVASPEAGYNIVRHVLKEMAEDKLLSESLIEWKKDDEVWYVSRIERREALTPGRKLYQVFEYVEFEPNAAVADTTFRFSELVAEGMPRRILDRRRGEFLLRRFILPEEDDKEDEQPVSMAEQLESMPPLLVHPPGPMRE